MSTLPCIEIIPREYNSEEEKELLHRLASKCEEIVNFGSQALNRCAKTIIEEEPAEHYLVLIMFFRHALEIIDSITILTRTSSIDPCKVLLRALLETVVGIEWMVAEKFENRAKAYIVWKAHNDLKLLTKLDPSTIQGKKFFAELRKERGNDEIKFDNIPFEDLRAVKTNLINAPSLARAEAEYQRILNEGKAPRKWYSMFAGEKPPTNIESLSRLVGKFDWYTFLYRTWSDATHAGDVITGKITQHNSIYQIRFVKDAYNVTLYTLLLGVAVIRASVSEYDEGLIKDTKSWYITEMRETILELSKNPKIIVK